MPGINYTVQINDAPASAEVLDAVREIQVENNSGMAGIFRLRLAIGMSDGGDWTVIEDDPFQPLTPVSIGIQAGTGLSEPLINGYVTSQQILLSNEPGRSMLEIIGMDPTVLMNLEEKVTAWPDMSDSDIAAVIFEQYGFVTDIDQTQPVRQENEITTIQRGSDIRFLRRLAERSGFECYVESDPVTNIMTGHFHRPRLQDRAQDVLSINFGKDTNVTSFSARYDMLQPTTAQASEVEIGSKSVQNAQAQTISENKLGREGTLERIQRQTVVLPAQRGLSNTGELQTLCQAVVDRSAWAIIAEGELDTAVYENILRASRTVNVRGAGNLFSGTYFVNKVLHNITGDTYSQRFELRKNAVGLTGTENFINTGALV